MRSLSILPKEISTSNISLTSTNKQIGYTEQDNVLKIKFTPASTMSRTGDGLIILTMPQWYISRKSNTMYDTSKRNQCTSDFMKITSSQARANTRTLDIYYEDMPEEFWAGTEIEINCRYFKNPISKKEWGPFYLETYDNEDTLHKIDASADYYFDTRTYEPFPMDRFRQSVNPAVFQIGIYSIWSLVVRPGLPMNQRCFIRIMIPPDLAFQDVNLIGDGIFRPINDPDNIISSNHKAVTVDPATGYTWLTIQGCHSASDVGESPAGTLQINKIQSPLAVKDTGEFLVEIYSEDVEERYLIATLNPGVYVAKVDLQPGPITDILFTPSDPYVQKSATYTIEFTVRHQLVFESLIEILLPPTLTLPSDSS